MSEETSNEKPRPRVSQRPTLSDRAVLGIFLAFALIAVAGWFLVKTLMANSKLEDCMMQHRRNCNQLIDE